MSWSSSVLGAMVAISAAACGAISAPREVQCGADPVEVLPNGSFDAATPLWVQDPETSALVCGNPRITPFDGAQSACLGGTDGTTETLSQTVPLPDGLKTLTLSGQICIDTLETDPLGNDTIQFDVVDGATTVAALGNQTNQQGTNRCQFTAFELSGSAISDPTEATLRIRSTLNTSKPTSFYLDKLSLKAACK